MACSPWRLRDSVTVATVLEREMYSEPEAARLLRVPPSTLHYWLQGGTRRGVHYAPVIRKEPTDRRSVTWAEFIEAGWLRTYRRRRGIPMVELRDFIELLRDEMGVPYPLAHEQPLVSGRKLILRAQTQSALAPQFRLVDEQLMLTYAAESFFKRVEWTGGLASGWRPDSNEDSSVIVKPNVRFGRPAVSGISTVAIFELEQAGASREEAAAYFDLAESDVGWALAYEDARRARRAS